MVSNSNPNSSWLNNTLFKTFIAIILMAVAAWGNWVTTAVTSYNKDLGKFAERLARIEQKLDDHFRSDDAQRHNP